LTVSYLEGITLAKARIAIVLGTRPEAIKMAPVIRVFQADAKEFATTIISTAQHRQMLDQVLKLFHLVPDLDLDLMRPNQDLNGLTARVLETMGDALKTLKPDLMLIQGDTTTVLGAALAAFYLKIPVGHVEAGLRSFDPYNPFPEEINRHLTSVLTNIHLAPTTLARQNLLNEGTAPEKIVVTGNTVVDALLSLQKIPFDGPSLRQSLGMDHHRLLLVTSHRRESWGRDLESICLAIKDLVTKFPDIFVVYPVHLNPKVNLPVHEILSGVDRVNLSPPQDYLTFVNLMRQAYLILTDSGGVQEEAPTFQVPLLVLRQVTERPEATQAGLAKLIGTQREEIVASASRLLADTTAYHQMQQGLNPFGDGHAATRIVKTVRRWLAGQYPLLPKDEEFYPEKYS
jgi:UDP-N-acetylglucosamine 2-epimerase (non-hydrolysing)